MTSDGVSSSSRVGWVPAEHVTGLEINLDAEQCRVLDLGLHVMRVSPKPFPNIRRSSSLRSCFVLLKEPSDGLEPSTPSLPFRRARNCRQLQVTLRRVRAVFG